jgi:hypothetical protein
MLIRLLFEEFSDTVLVVLASGEGINFSFHVEKHRIFADDSRERFV